MSRTANESLMCTFCLLLFFHASVYIQERGAKLTLNICYAMNNTLPGWKKKSITATVLRHFRDDIQRWN